MGQITLSTGDVVQFDDSDADVVAAYQWHLHRTPTVLYARGYQRGKPRREASLVYMHRLLVGAAPGDEVDHANGDSTIAAAISGFARAHRTQPIGMPWRPRQG
jgi:hypothetical protein